MLNELVIKNTPVKELILFYQPEEYPTLINFWTSLFNAFYV